MKTRKAGNTKWGGDRLAGIRPEQEQNPIPETSAVLQVCEKRGSVKAGDQTSINKYIEYSSLGICRDSREATFIDIL
jgi:hypothetical protein